MYGVPAENRNGYEILGSLITGYLVSISTKNRADMGYFRKGNMGYSDAQNGINFEELNRLPQKNSGRLPSYFGTCPSFEIMSHSVCALVGNDILGGSVVVID